MTYRRKKPLDILYIPQSLFTPSRGHSFGATKKSCQQSLTSVIRETKGKILFSQLSWFPLTQMPAPCLATRVQQKANTDFPPVLSLPNSPEADVTGLQRVFQTNTLSRSLPKQPPILTGQTVFSGASHHQADWERHPPRKNIYAQQQCLV